MVFSRITQWKRFRCPDADYLEKNKDYADIMVQLSALVEGRLQWLTVFVILCSYVFVDMVVYYLTTRKRLLLSIHLSILQCQHNKLIAAN